MAKITDCTGQHRYFALELIAQESTRTVIVALACTQCGELKTHIINVADVK